MKNSCESAFNRAKHLIEKKKTVLMTNQINNALSVIHETKYSTVLDYLKDKGINTADINDFTKKDDDNKVKVYHIQAGTKVDEHCHDFNESYICLFGNVVLNVGNEIKQLKSFETMTIKTGVPHSAEVLEDSFLIIFKN
ncbi:MAG: hypothetical protein HC836_35290 [Richelia sp. RM2_1_2]|nr:hypothetical protein [Richelia sp. RM2_1_2]